MLIVRADLRNVSQTARRKLTAVEGVADREGFEPPETLASTVFKTAALDRSAICPNGECTGEEVEGVPLCGPKEVHK